MIDMLALRGARSSNLSRQVGETFDLASWLVEAPPRASRSAQDTGPELARVNPLLIPLVFVIVLIAELPDKSMFASLVLGTRFRPQFVFLGVAAAFAVHVVVAVAAGDLLSLLPRRIVEVIVGVLFLAGAIYLWFSSQEEAEETGVEGQSSNSSRSPFAAFGTSFTVVFIGEWGDITQILTANLAAKYHDPIAVGIGSLLGLWTAALLAVTLGQTLLRFISIKWLHRTGAAILLGFAIYTAFQLR